MKMPFRQDLLEYAPADYDVNKIGFILIQEEQRNEDSMDIDYELTPEASENAQRSTCHICNRKYINSSNLRRHLNTVHSGEEFVCVVCSVKCDNKRELSYHMKKHTNQPGSSQLSCDHCGRKEKTKTAMLQHLEIHQTLGIDIDDILGF